MATIEVNGQTVELDEDGFMVDPDMWTEDIAKYFAAGEGITGELTDEHWKVIRYVRDYYKQFQIAPMVRKLCKETGCNLKAIYELFPSGPAKGACKLAGLPKPTGCV
jgi:tRNA 2-thiouridine synthesizing protein E